jgi:hypothetical protein
MSYIELPEPNFPQPKFIPITKKSNKFFNDEFNNLEMRKEEIYKKLSGKNVTVIFTENEDIGIFALKDEYGMIYVIDETINYK